jgi:hypothetical protein
MQFLSCIALFSIINYHFIGWFSVESEQGKELTMAKVEKLTFDKFEITLDPENLRFSEQTLTEYIQKEAGYYDNIGAYLAMAERHLQNKEVQYEKLFSERFVEAKEDGASDKLAEAKSKCDVDVVTIKEQIVEARYVVNRLKNHMKAWDKNHDNAQSLGHMLRKQMDKLNAEIMGSHGWQGSTLDKDVASTVKSFDEQEEKNSGFEDNLTVENLL